MKRLRIIAASTLVVVGGLWGLSQIRAARTRGNLENEIQGKPTREWLFLVEVGGKLNEPNPAWELLASAGPRVIPESSEILFAPEGIKALTQALSDTNAEVSLAASQAFADIRQIGPGASSDR